MSYHETELDDKIDLAAGEGNDVDHPPTSIVCSTDDIKHELVDPPEVHTIRINCPGCNRKTDLVDGKIAEHEVLKKDRLTHPDFAKGPHTCVWSNMLRRSGVVKRRKYIAETGNRNGRKVYLHEGEYQRCQRTRTRRKADKTVGSEISEIASNTISHLNTRIEELEAEVLTLTQDAAGEDI